MALVSLPAPGVLGQQRHAREVIVGLVEELLGWLGGIRASSYGHHPTATVGRMQRVDDEAGGGEHRISRMSLTVPAIMPATVTCTTAASTTRWASTPVSWQSGCAQGCRCGWRCSPLA